MRKNHCHARHPLAANPSRRRTARRWPTLLGGWLALTVTTVAALPVPGTGNDSDEDKSSSWKQDVLVGNWNNEDNWTGPDGHKTPTNHWVGDEYWVYSVSVPPAGFGLGSGLTVHLDISPSIGQLSISGGATVSISPGLGLYLTQRTGSSPGNISNGGTIVIGGGGTLGFTTDDETEEQKINGAGVIRLESSTSSYLTGQKIFHSSYHTIEGSGNVQIMDLTNQGLLRTTMFLDTLSIGVPIPLYAGRSLLTNDGVVEADGGGTVSIQYGRIDNAGGVIRAKNDSTVSIGDVEVTGGTLTTSGTGVIDLAVTSLANLTTNGQLRLSSMIFLKRDPLVLGEQSITNNGVITFQDRADSFATGIRVNAEHITLDGTGVIDMGTNGKGTIGGAGCPGHTCVNQLTLAAGQVVQGAGLLGNTQVGVINHGTIRATANQPLIVQPSSGGVVNHGIMEADGGTLWLKGPVNFVNTDGVIRYLGDSNVEISNSARVAGGVLAGSGTGAIRIGYQAYLQNLTNTGRIIVPSANTLSVTGTIVNDGLIRTEGVYGNPAKIRLDLGDFTLAGNGALEMTGQEDVLSSTAGQLTRTLTNGAAHTIRGEGTFGGDFLNIVNHGRILANRANPLIVNPAAGGLDNLGILEAAPGAKLIVWDTLKNYNASTKTLTGGRYEIAGTMGLPVTGLVRNAAAIVLDGVGSNFYVGNTLTDALAAFTENLAAGSFELRNGRDVGVGAFSNAGSMLIGAESGLVASSYTQTAGVTMLNGVLAASGDVALLGGVLEGTGSVWGNLSNAGELAPGNSPGALNITGDYLQTTGTLTIELGATDYDRIVVGGDAVLGGTLAVKLWSASATFPFAPAAGTWFDIVTAETISGAFATTLLPVLPGIGWSLTHLVDVSGSTDVLRLSVGPPVPLPPAVWLLGSAGAVLALFRRRSRTR